MHLFHNLNGVALHALNVTRLTCLECRCGARPHMTSTGDYKSIFCMNYIIISVGSDIEVPLHVLDLTGMPFEL